MDTGSAESRQNAVTLTGLTSNLLAFSPYTLQMTMKAVQALYQQNQNLANTF